MSYLVVTPNGMTLHESATQRIAEEWRDSHLPDAEVFPYIEMEVPEIFGLG